jgi:hypothetical protein
MYLHACNGDMHYICRNELLTQGNQLITMFRVNQESSSGIDISVDGRTNETTRHSTLETPVLSGSEVNPGKLLYFRRSFMTVLFRNQGRLLKIGLMMMVFITALYTKSYSGDFQVLINNHIGGIFYVLFGSLAFSVLLPRMKIIFPVILATGSTCILEFVQWFRFPFMVELTRIKTFAYLFGNSFNPSDFIYYGMGSVLALLALWAIREN